MQLQEIPNNNSNKLYPLYTKMVLHLHKCNHLKSPPVTIYSTCNPLMLLPIHLKPQKHVYSILYMFVHISDILCSIATFTHVSSTVFIYMWSLKYTLSSHIGFKAKFQHFMDHFNVQITPKCTRSCTCK